MSTPTPRTDTVVAPYIGQDDVSVEECDKLLDHARQLERELEEAWATYALVTNNLDGVLKEQARIITSQKAALVKEREALHRSSGRLPSRAIDVFETAEEALTTIDSALGGGNLEAESKGLPDAHPNRLANQRCSDCDGADST